MKRAFDIIFSSLLLVLLFPLFLLLALLIASTSPGGVFFRQVRVGKDGREFRLLKFRTMRPGSETKGQVTIGERDPRITSIGLSLRKSKCDELPQLLNVLVGDMSVVGPRPEVPKYVAMYTQDQRRVLGVRPGLTGPASLQYIDENALLGGSPDPERTYMEEVMPAKLAIDLRYVEQRTFGTDLRIIAATAFGLFR